MKKFRVGIVGCGAISAAYLNHAKNFPILEIAACADLVLDAAKNRATEFSVPKACSVDELLADKSIDGVLNLTIPKVHAEVALKAIAAGKHVYSEKPLGIERSEGQRVLEAAKAKGLRVGNAPDTFLGSAQQTARRAIDLGMIGKPVAVTAFMLSRGHESWHPSPEFYYEVGGGPMFDMGPYYLTTLINMLGPIKRVAGSAGVQIPSRTITSQPKFGKTISVQTPDHVAGTIEFANGAIATIIMSFAMQHNVFGGSHPIVVSGTAGTMLVSDPNGFDGEIKISRAPGAPWEVIANDHTPGYGRAVGLAEMAHAILTNRPHRASGELAFAVLDAMQGFLDAGATGVAQQMTTHCNRPEPLPTGLKLGELD